MKGIAITGVSLRCPGANDINEFLAILEEAKVCMNQPDKERKKYSQIPEKETFYPYGYLDRIDCFDHKFFKISKAEADAIDPAYRVLLELVCEAVENSGYDLDYVASDRTGLFVTVNQGYYNFLYQSPNPELDFIGSLPAMAAGRVAHLLNIRGPVMNIDTACSSSLVAVHEAVQKLNNHEIDVAIVGGARFLYTFNGKEELQNDAILAPDGLCKAFDSNANGTSGGEGAAVIILKRLETASGDNDTILSVIKGSAINHDGKLSNGLASPSPVAQKELLLAAGKKANVPMNSIGYLETHGTGTKLGDPIEYKAIKDAFSEGGNSFSIRLGTLKPNIGHLDNMSGLMGLIKAGLTLRKKQFFPLANFNTVNTFITEDPGILLKREGDSWEVPENTIRRAGVSAFGLSGTNAHVILEEYIEDEITENTDVRHQLWFKISAKSKNAMEAYADSILAFLSSLPEKRLPHAAFTLNRGRADYDYGIGLYGATVNDLQTALKQQKKIIKDLLPRPKTQKIAYLLLSDLLDESLITTFRDPECSAFYNNALKTFEAAGIYEESIAFQVAFYHYLQAKGFVFSHIICNGTLAKNAKKIIENKYDSLEADPEANQSEPINWDKLKSLLSILSAQDIALMVVGGNRDTLHTLEELSHENSVTYIHVNNTMANGWGCLWSTLYNKGGHFNWDMFYKTDNCKRVEAPTYPFEKISCWNSIKNPAFFQVENKTGSLSQIVHVSEEDEARVIIEILGETLQNKSFDPEDDFFDLGGNSIVGTQFINRINDLLGIHMQFDELYDCYSINDIVSLIKGKRKERLHVVDAAVKIPEKSKDPYYPLTNSQYRIWVDSQNIEGSIAYNINLNVAIHGNVDESCFEKAVKHLIKVHDNFRLLFKVNEEGDVQQKLVAPEEIDFKLQMQDARDASESAIYKSIEKHYNEPFNLENGPLLRVKLIRQGEEDYILVLSFHHLIFDGWSSGNFLNELVVTYNALLAGTEASQQSASVQYTDYIRWFARATTEDKLAPHKAYWNTKLNGTIEPLNLGVKKDFQSFAGQRRQYIINEAQKTRLEKLARENRTTLFVLLLASIRSYLYQLSGQNIIIGTPISGRLKKEFETTLGLFINTLPLKTEIHKEQSFTECLNNEKQTVTEALQHQLYPYDLILDDLEIKREKGHSLFDVMIVFQNQNNRYDLLSEEALSLPFVIGPGVEISDLQTNFDLTFTFFDVDKTLELHLEYNTNVFRDGIIDSIMENYLFYLDKLLAEPGESVKTIDFIGPEERHKLLHTFNDTQLDYDREQTFLNLIAEQAAKGPHNTALIFKDEPYTYEYIDTVSSRLANYLTDVHHIEPGNLVGVKLDRSEWLVISLLAVMKSGAAYVPIDPNYPKDRIAYIEQDSSCVLTIDRKVISAFEDVQLNYPSKIDISTVIPDQLAYIIYTSGSTGNPKGVMITHQNATALINWSRQEFDPEVFDMVYAVTSHCFDLSIFELFYSMSIGKPIRLLQNALEIEKYMAEDRKVLINTVPSVIKSLLDGGADFTNVTVINMAGEPLPVSIVKQLDIENIQVRNLYGPSEDTTYSTGYRVRHTHFNSVPIGKPISNTKVYIVNDEYELRPTGVAGELCLGGEGLARGYLNKEALTKEKFVNNPFEKGEKMYCTGDLAYWLPDGTLEYIGRKDAQVKIRGYRIELGEIESMILKQQEYVKNAVVAVKDKGAEKVIVAYIVCHDEKDDDTVKQHLKYKLKSFLPDYMLPTYYVCLDKIPLTPNGKVDRKALPDVGGEDILKNAYVAPENETQETLVTIWESFLKIDRIGVLDNFFQLGGNSLMAVKVIAKINTAFKTEFPLDILFHIGTIKEIADYIENGYTFNQDYYILGNPEATQTVFAFPPILGYGTAYKALFDECEDTRIIAFNFVDHKEDIFAYYAEAIQELQPEGALTFFGWSAGGNISYELEKILRKQHERDVANVIMIDSYARANDNWEEEDFEYMDDFVKYDLGLKELLLQSSNVLYKAKNKMYEYFKTIHAITYDAKSDARLFLIKSSEPMDDYNWESFFESITYLEGDGGHYDMLKEEHLTGNRALILNVINDIIKNRAQTEKTLQK